MAVRTVTVDLRLDAGSYLAIARSVERANQAIDRSFNDMGASAAAAGSAANFLGRDLQRMGARARIAERRVKELREEVDRLIAAQAAMRAGGPIPPIIGPAAGAGRGGGGMLGMIGTPAGVAVVAGIAAAGPAIGSVIGAAVLAGVGGAGLAAGIIAAAKSSAVRGAWGEFGSFLKEEFAKYGHAFEEPLVAAAENWHDRFASMSPKIRATLAQMAAGVKPLADGVADFVERFGPGFASAMRDSLPVIKAIAGELGDAGQAAGDFLKAIGAGSEGAADGVVMLMKSLEYLGYATGTQILYLEKLFALAGDMPAIFGASGGLLQSLGLIGGGDTHELIDLNPVADQIGRVRFETSWAVEYLEKMHHALMAVTEGFNNSYGAAIGYEEAIDNLSESVRENGRSMDIGTEKGRANARALMEVFEAARKTYDANIASGMSAGEAARRYNEQIERGKQVAISAGLAADEVNRLAAAQRALPTGVRTFTYKTIFLTEGQSPGGPGRHYAYRDGGIHYARDGLMAFGNQSGIASGGRPLIGFAEPGTGGEAFIARNAPAGRSLAIANTAAGWHGGQVVPKGNMPHIRITIPPAPTNANRQIIDAVTHQLRVDVQRQSGGDVQRHLGSSGRP